MPDIAIARLDLAGVLLNLPCIDYNTALTFNTGGGNNTNGLVIMLNSNPNNGQTLWSNPTTVTSGFFNPVNTYTSKYSKFRCHGCKVNITFIYADNGSGAAAVDTVAKPFQVTGFPFQQGDTTLANYWDGTSAANYNAGNIPMMKYGFRRISSGLGGRVMVKYKTYWEIPKLCGLTDTQWLADDRFVVSSSNNTRPGVQAYLALHISDFITTAAREVSVQMKITQYGRWEGQQADYS